MGGEVRVGIYEVNKYMTLTTMYKINKLNKDILFSIGITANIFVITLNVV